MHIKLFSFTFAFYKRKMEKPKIPYLKINFKNDFELIDKLLKIYDLAKERKPDEKPLRKFERDILIYYIKYGYSKDTKKMIEEHTGKKSNAIIQTDFLLKQGGYLEDLENNYRMKKLNPHLEMIRADFIKKTNRAYGLWFEQSK